MIAGKQRLFLHKPETEMVRRVSGRGEGFERRIAKRQSHRFGEDHIRRVVAVMRRVQPDAGHGDVCGLHIGRTTGDACAGGFLEQLCGG